VKLGSSARKAASDWTGRKSFGKWAVERLIAIGGTSTVLQARHPNGRRAALKVLHQHLAAHGRTRERFLREGRLANLVDHPGVVAVLDDFVTEDGTAVLVLELVHGKTLAMLAKESGGALGVGEVVEAAVRVLEILAVAHDANVIHRDIKPENILRCTDGGYKLADFGLAALCHDLGVLTGTNASLGTPAYMSPEQARGETRSIDARTDIWGLGATMFTLLTGRFLHATSEPRSLIVAAATEPAPSISSIEPSIEAPLAHVIDRALRMDKEERWPNARAMLAELEAIDISKYEVAAPRAISLDDGATLPTQQSSLTSWSHAGSWLRRAELPAKRRTAAILGGIGIVAMALLLAWTRLGGAPTTTASSSIEAAPADLAGTVSTATAVTPSPAAPTETTPGESTSPPLPATIPSARSLSPKARALPRASSDPAQKPAPSAATVVREPDLTVPDEVLDRRD
jgi:serine/threonine-protein kinase